MKLFSCNPATEEVIGSAEMSTTATVHKKVVAAQHAFQTWKQIPIDERIAHLRKIIPLLQQQQNKLATLITREMGKPLKESLGEVEKTIELIAYFCDHVHECFQESHVTISQQLSATITNIPRGVIGVIMPWNYPLSTPMWSIIPAIVTGNTVVFKPSEYTSLIGKELVALLNKVLPQHVVQAIYGDRHVGAQLVTAPVSMVAFVGSQAAGKNIMKAAAEQLHKLVFELGGKAPAFVCKECDVIETAKGIVFGALRNCGQVCSSIEKVYVEKGIEKQLIHKILQEVKKLKVGNGLDASVDLGPLVNKQQLAKVDHHVQDAVKKGARILYGGKRLPRKGYFFEPTVLIDVREDMLVMKEETFGPVIPISVVKNIDEAVKLSNELFFGLSATVWCDNREKARIIADQLDVGTVAINGIVRTSPSIPWGGVKQSGFGRMLGIEGMKEYVQSRAMYVHY